MFAISKIFWWVADPSNIWLLILLLGTALLWTGWRRLGRGLVTLSILAAIAIAVLPFMSWMLAPLENRFPTLETIDEPVTGIITLGGAVNQFLTVDRGQPSLHGSVERLTEFVALARRYPEAQLLYTGGSGSLTNQSVKEVVVAEQLFRQLGLDVGRVVFEDRSRNTFENAVFSYELVRPAPEQRWVLITSAAHMPRAYGVFRTAGWNVIPYPVDYSTFAHKTPGFGLSLGNGLLGLSYATKEWMGLIAYWLLGRTRELLPGPSRAPSPN